MWRRPALFRCPCEDTDVEVKLREYRLQPRTVKGEDDEGNSISSTMAVKELTEVMVTGSELLTKIEAAATEYFTRWNCRWANTARLNDMHKFTDTELFIQTDFAAQISNAAQDNLCCTHRNHTNLDVFVVASDPRLVDVTVKHADGSSSFVKKRITDNHAWKFYAGASGKGKDNDYFFHHAALTHLVDFYVAKRVKDNKPPLTRVILWTDGCPGQYMCKENFVKVAAFWSKKGIELTHRFASARVPEDGPSLRDDGPIGGYE
ncbi:hypothetical protein SO694_00176015 [Aureococcus anophagefferens]|uniref:Uncharacterized protein n=1 Tax=Aureococcus anophagefferens TaxID=44056 RepID=A0ABR1FGT1_AURAN